MVVVFANQKGGVGKTTLAIAYANHLAESGKSVLLVDTDTQRSCTFKRAEEKENFSEDAIRYQILDFSLTNKQDSTQLMNNAHQLSREKGITVIIDVPGNITEEFLAPIFINADYIICPFQYQSLTLESTSTFVKVIMRLKSSIPQMKADLIFIPNMVERNFGLSDELKTFRLMDDILGQFGALTPRVYYRAELKRISTILYTAKQKSELDECFACIDSHIF